MSLPERLEFRRPNRATSLPVFEQLELFDCSRPALSGRSPAGKRGDRAPRLQWPPTRVHDSGLSASARALLRANGAGRIANDVRVEWNSRLKTCAGRADYKAKLISLNPRLRDHASEVERTFRHELAHLLAQFRSGRRRILPHGKEWRRACYDLGISDEKRCHNLPFPMTQRARRFLYKCPKCLRDFPRVRRIRRAVACLACCRAHNRGEFDHRFRLQLVR